MIDIISIYVRHVNRKSPRGCTSHWKGVPGTVRLTVMLSQKGWQLNSQRKIIMI